MQKKLQHKCDHVKKAIMYSVLISIFIVLSMYGKNLIAFSKYKVKTTTTVPVSFCKISRNFENETTSKQYSSLQIALDEASSGDTIKVLESTEDSAATIASDMNIILDLNGKTVTSTGTTIINSGTLEVKDTSTEQTGTISTTSSSSSYYAIYNANAATFTLTSGTISGTYRAIENYYTGVTTIVGGTVKVTGTTSSTYAIYNYGTSSYIGTINIIGGIITSGGCGIYNHYSSLVIGLNDSTVSSSSPVISGGTYGVYRSSGTISFYDGILKGTTAGYYGTIANTPTGYGIVTGASGNYKTAVLVEGVAAIGTTGYSTLTAAIAAVPTDGTETVINMLSDVSGTTYTIPSTKNVFLDLKGYTITSTGTTITNNGILTLQDSGAANGTLSSTGTSSYALYNASGSIFNMNSGIIQGTYGGVENYRKCTVTVLSGTIQSTSSYAMYNYGSSSYKGNITIYGCDIKSASSRGIYNYYSTLTLGEDDGDVQGTSSRNICIEGSTYGLYNVSGTINFYDGMLFGQTQAYYGTITNTPTGYLPTVTYNANNQYVAYPGIPIAKMDEYNYDYLSTCIDLVPTTGTQKTITLLNDISGISYDITSGQNILLDLAGYTINTPTNLNGITNVGTLTIKDSGTGGTITSTGNYPVIENNIGGTCTLNSGTISSEYVAIKNNGSATLKIVGGTVNANKSYGIYNSGTVAYKGSVTITGGTINSESSYGIYNEYSTLTLGVNNSTVSTSVPSISGTYGLYRNSGTIYFYDGIIKGTTSAYYGSITYKMSGYSIVSGTSGSYKTAYLKLDTVYVAKIGNTKYETLKSAVEAVPTDGTQTTITLINNTSESDIAISSSESVILDLNGKTITASGNGIINAGDLKIQDSGSTGTINATNYAVYNNSGTVYIANGNFYSTDTVIYNTGSFAVTIISGGTIRSTGGIGIYNEVGSAIVLGTDDNTVSSTNPQIIGETYGISSNGTSSYAYFYDGIVKGKTAAFNNVYVNKLTDGSGQNTGTDGDYKTIYVQ